MIPLYHCPKLNHHPTLKHFYPVRYHTTETRLISPPLARRNDKQDAPYLIDLHVYLFGFKSFLMVYQSLYIYLLYKNFNSKQKVIVDRLLHHERFCVEPTVPNKGKPFKH